MQRQQPQWRNNSHCVSMAAVAALLCLSLVGAASDNGARSGVFRALSDPTAGSGGPTTPQTADALQATGCPSIKRFEIAESQVRDGRVQLIWNTSVLLVNASRKEQYCHGLHDTDVEVNCPIDRREFIVTLDVPEGTAPADLGFINHEHGPQMQVDNASLRLVGRPSTMELDIGPFPDLKLQTATEVLGVYVTPRWFKDSVTTFCDIDLVSLPANETAAIRIAEVAVVPPRNALEEVTQLATRFIGDTALASEILSAIADGGVDGTGVGDVTSIAIISAMSCARPAQREAGSNSRLISPIPLDDSMRGMVLGNFMVCASIIAFHVIITVVVILIQRTWKNPLASTQLMRFPSWSIAILGVLNHGTTFLSLRLILDNLVGETGNSTAVVVGFIGLIYAMAVPSTATMIATRMVDAMYVLYDFEAPSPDRDTPMAMKWRRILPRGRWEPREMRRAYGRMLAPFEREHPMWFVVFSFASPSMIAIMASASPGTRDGCVAQYTIMGVAQFCFVLFFLRERPYRSKLSNTLVPISAMTVSTLSLASAIGIAYPESDAPFNVGAVAILAQGVLTFTRVSYVFFCLLIESRLTTGVVLRPQLQRVPLRYPCDTERHNAKPTLPGAFTVVNPPAVSGRHQGNDTKGSASNGLGSASRNGGVVGLGDDLHATLLGDSDHDDVRSLQTELVSVNSGRGVEHSTATASTGGISESQMIRPPGDTSLSEPVISGSRGVFVPVQDISSTTFHTFLRDARSPTTPRTPRSPWSGRAKRSAIPAALEEPLPTRPDGLERAATWAGGMTVQLPPALTKKNKEPVVQRIKAPGTNRDSQSGDTASSDSGLLDGVEEDVPHVHHKPPGIADLSSLGRCDLKDIADLSRSQAPGDDEVSFDDDEDLEIDIDSDDVDLDSDTADSLDHL